jgi:hypothetical protein
MTLKTNPMDKWVIDHIKKQRYPKDKEVCTPIYLQDDLLIFGKGICGEWGSVNIPTPYKQGNRLKRVYYAGSIHTHPKMPSKVCQELRKLDLSPHQIKVVEELNQTVSPTDITAFLDAGIGDHYCYHLPTKTLSVGRVRRRPDKKECQEIENAIYRHKSEITDPDNTNEARLRILEDLTGGSLDLEIIGIPNGKAARD